jgi:glycosyltransferase A (GT-A) superfamily protein (DUF2064 family)
VRPAVALIVAKSPVAGRVKTRLGREVGMARAADLAAAALLDTVDACTSAYGAGRCHLALEGTLARGRMASELLGATAGWRFHPQRGVDFAERLVNAHEEVAAVSGAPVVQVGMDTPHLQAQTLVEVGDRLTHPDRAVLGPAYDGGWWLLGVGDPKLLVHLRQVPMSTHETGTLTREALVRAGARVTGVGMLRDVDGVADAEAVAASAPGTRFARAFVGRVR